MRLLKKISIAGLLLSAGLHAFPQSSGPAAHSIDPDLLHFFVGRWTGEGQLAQGQKIGADLSFTPSLDSCWLVYEHHDRLPNRYAATSMWGVDGSSGEFAAYCFDNFHGHRRLSSNGWKDGRLVLTGQAYYPHVGLIYQHFIYERTGDDQFKMTFATSRDGIGWQLVDWVLFNRKP